MPAHDIVDNHTEKLVDHINRILPSTERAKFAVGYFFLSGLEPTEKNLENVREHRLLIINTTNQETLEQLSEGRNGPFSYTARWQSGGGAAGKFAIISFLFPSSRLRTNKEEKRL